MTCPSARSALFQIPDEQRENTLEVSGLPTSNKVHFSFQISKTTSGFAEIFYTLKLGLTNNLPQRICQEAYRNAFLKPNQATGKLHRVEKRQKNRKKHM